MSSPDVHDVTDTDEVMDTIVSSNALPSSNYATGTSVVDVVLSPPRITTSIFACSHHFLTLFDESDASSRKMHSITTQDTVDRLSMDTLRVYVKNALHIDLHAPSIDTLIRQAAATASSENNRVLLTHIHHSQDDVRHAAVAAHMSHIYRQVHTLALKHALKRMIATVDQIERVGATVPVGFNVNPYEVRSMHWKVDSANAMNTLTIECVCAHGRSMGHQQRRRRLASTCFGSELGMTIEHAYFELRVPPTSLDGVVTSTTSSH